MNRRRELPPGDWLPGFLLPRDRAEAVLGDLVEEFALRAEAEGRRAALRWYWSQLGRSLPRLAWASTTDRLWLRTWGVAAAGFVLATLIELGLLAGLANLWPSSADKDLVHLLVWLIAIALTGFVAARLQPSSPFALAVVTVAVAVALTIRFGAMTPLWLQLAFFLLGPAACLAGAALARRGRDSSEVR